MKSSQAPDAEEKYKRILSKKQERLLAKVRGDEERRKAVQAAYDVLSDKTKRTLYDQGGNEAVEAGTADGVEIRFVSEECRVILERVVKAGLAMEVFFSRDEDEIFVKLGAAESILMDEASHAEDPDFGGNSPMILPLKLKYKNQDQQKRQKRRVKSRGR